MKTGPKLARSEYGRWTGVVLRTICQRRAVAIVEVEPPVAAADVAGIPVAANLNAFGDEDFYEQLINRDGERHGEN